MWRPVFLIQIRISCPPLEPSFATTSSSPASQMANGRRPRSSRLRHCHCTRQRMCCTTRVPALKASRPTAGRTAKRASSACTIMSRACKRAPHPCVCRCRRPTAMAQMVIDIVAHNVEDIPEPPSSLYLRPTLIGTLPNIGAAAAPSTEATLFVSSRPRSVTTSRVERGR